MRVLGHGIEVLTNRERQVAALIFEGLANKEIAQRLSLSERTVETHVASICNRLGFRSRVQIATWVARLGTSSGTAVAVTPPRLASASKPLPPWPVLAIMAIGAPIPVLAVVYQWSQASATPSSALLDGGVTVAAAGLLLVPAASLEAMRQGRAWAKNVAVVGLLVLGVGILLLAAYALAAARLSTGAITLADGFEFAYAVLLLPLLLLHLGAILAWTRSSPWAKPLVTIAAAFWIIRFGYGLSLATLALWIVWRSDRRLN